MTPLASKIVKELTLPKKERTFVDTVGLLQRMSDIHCFEVTEIAGLASETVCQDEGKFLACAEQTSFLPARRTWVEWRIPSGAGRIGFLLEDVGGHAVIWSAAWTADGVASYPWRFSLPLIGSDLMRMSHDVAPRDQSEVMRKHSTLLTAFLAFINTPRIIGRRQHMPHRGLERRLAAQRPAIGKFPLHAWTEIKLHVTPPHDASGEKSTEAHLTGERALHFCRAHLRIRLGKLEVVRGHWRGDASLGIRRSRYVLKADRGARS